MLRHRLLNSSAIWLSIYSICPHCQSASKLSIIFQTQYQSTSIPFTLFSFHVEWNTATWNPLSIYSKFTLHPQTSPKRLQSLILKVSQILADISTASPMSFPCFPSSRSTSASVYSPLMWGTLMVMTISVDSFSSLIKFSTIAVKSGDCLRTDSTEASGVWVAIRVYVGVSFLPFEKLARDM